MSRCKKCGFENKDGSKFCGHCGAPLKTRSSGKGIIIGVCIVLVMVGITVAVLFLTGRSQQTDIELPIFSKRIWDYDGTIYTSYDVEHTGWTSLTGDDHGTFIVYLDNIHLRKTNNANDATRVLFCRDMTGKETVIADDANPLYDLVIYDDHLYYVALDSSMQSKG